MHHKNKVLLLLLYEINHNKYADVHKLNHKVEPQTKKKHS